MAAKISNPPPMATAVQHAPTPRAETGGRVPPLRLAAVMQLPPSTGPASRQIPTPRSELGSRIPTPRRDLGSRIPTPRGEQGSRVPLVSMAAVQRTPTAQVPPGRHISTPRSELGSRSLLPHGPAFTLVPTPRSEQPTIYHTPARTAERYIPGDRDQPNRYTPSELEMPDNQAPTPRLMLGTRLPPPHGPASTEPFAPRCATGRLLPMLHSIPDARTPTLGSEAVGGTHFATDRLAHTPRGEPGGRIRMLRNSPYKQTLPSLQYGSGALDSSTNTPRTAAGDAAWGTNP